MDLPRCFVRRSVWASLLAAGLAVGGCAGDVSQVQPPPRTAYQADLAPGIQYRRQVLDVPRPVMVHLLRIDLRTPGLQVLTTPGVPGLADRMETVAMTTREFARRHGMQVAINASFFYPFKEQVIGGYPNAGDPVNVVGQAISNGVAYSPPEDGPPWVMLCFDARRLARVVDRPACPEATAEAVSGNTLVLWQGAPAPTEGTSDALRPYPRTVVGTEHGGEVLWVMLVDGKQEGYSEGMTLPEVAAFLAPLGVDAVLNLDGGGSTTLVAADLGQAPRLVNSPVHQRTAMRERPVANHLGFRVLPQR